MEEEKKSYYAIIPANVRYDEELTPNAKLLYGEITALCNEKGYCWASNDYFAKLYGASRSSITRWISQLANKGYISTKMVFVEGTSRIDYRCIQICDDGIRKNEHTLSAKLSIPYQQNCDGGIRKNDADNNTSNNTLNNTSNNTLNKSSTHFVKPTLHELKDYLWQQELNIDAQYFLDYYESKGWMVGKNHMKDWKAAARNWARREEKNSKPKDNEFEDKWKSVLEGIEEDEQKGSNKAFDGS